MPHTIKKIIFLYALLLCSIIMPKDLYISNNSTWWGFNVHYNTYNQKIRTLAIKPNDYMINLGALDNITDIMLSGTFLTASINNCLAKAKIEGNNPNNANKITMISITPQYTGWECKVEQIASTPIETFETIATEIILADEILLSQIARGDLGNMLKRKVNEICEQSKSLCATLRAELLALQRIMMNEQQSNKTRGAAQKTDASKFSKQIHAIVNDLYNQLPQ